MGKAFEVELVQGLNDGAGRLDCALPTFTGPDALVRVAAVLEIVKQIQR
jgi:hypothetical protein